MPRNKNHYDASNMEVALRFLLWTIAKKTFPTVDEIMTEFQVSRATAYRWRAFLASARGRLPPPFQRPTPATGADENVQLDPR